MSEIIEQLYSGFYKRPNSTEEKQRLQSNTALLKHNFSKWQKKILLRIIDDKDIICAIVTKDSFEQGFRLGVKLTTEIYNHKGGIPDEYSGMSPLL